MLAPLLLSHRRQPRRRLSRLHGNGASDSQWPLPVHQYASVRRPLQFPPRPHLFRLASPLPRRIPAGRHALSQRHHRRRRLRPFDARHGGLRHARPLSAPRDGPGGQRRLDHLLCPELHLHHDRAHHRRELAHFPRQLQCPAVAGPGHSAEKRGAASASSPFSRCTNFWADTLRPPFPTPSSSPSSRWE